MVQEKSARPKTAPAAAPREPRTFDIDRIDPDDAIRVDGVSYRLAQATDLSIIKQAAMRRATKRMAYLEGKDSPTAKDDAEWRKLAQELARIAMPDAPEAIVAKLSFEQLQSVIAVFFGRAAETSKILRLMPELLSSFPSPSRPSSTSTAETR